MSRCHMLEHIEWTRAYENRFDQMPSPENYARDASGAPIWGDGNNGTPDAVFKWHASVGVRYTSNQFDDLDNGDTVQNVFGAIDPYTFVDLNLRYRLDTGGRMSFGINNLTNETAFVHHPWPQWTFFGEFSVDVPGDLFSSRP